MMCDTNWCTFCDNAISHYSDSLYCSEECLRQDASSQSSRDYSHLISTDSCSKSIYFNSSTPPLLVQSSSLSSSLSSTFSQNYEKPNLIYQPKPRRLSPIQFMDHL